MSRKSIWFLLSFMLLFGRLISFAAVPEIGQKAPDFTLSTVDGHAMSFYEIAQARPVVLVMLRGYPGYQCPYCTRQVHDFVESASKFAAAGAQVVLIYPGPPAALDEHAKEFLAAQNPLPANVHLLVDPDYKVTTQYDLRWDAPHETAYPSTFIIDSKKTVLFQKVSKGHGDRTSAADVLSELHRASTHD